MIAERNSLKYLIWPINWQLAMIWLKCYIRWILARNYPWKLCCRSFWRFGILRFLGLFPHKNRFDNWENDFFLNSWQIQRESSQFRYLCTRTVMYSCECSPTTAIQYGGSSQNNKMMNSNEKNCPSYHMPINPAIILSMYLMINYIHLHWVHTLAAGMFKFQTNRFTMNFTK